VVVFEPTRPAVGQQIRLNWALMPNLFAQGAFKGPHPARAVI